VAEDHAVLVAVRREQGGQPLTGRPQPVDRDGDVLEQRDGPGRPAFRDGGVQALADVPQGVPCVPQIRIGFVTRSGVSLQVMVAELVTGN
jgi:hypothetical protein